MKLRHDGEFYRRKPRERSLASQGPSTFVRLCPTFDLKNNPTREQKMRAAQADMPTKHMKTESKPRPTRINLRFAELIQTRRLILRGGTQYRSWQGVISGKFVVNLWLDSGLIYRAFVVICGDLWLFFYLRKGPTIFNRRWTQMNADGTQNRGTGMASIDIWAPIQASPSLDGMGLLGIAQSAAGRRLAEQCSALQHLMLCNPI